MYLIRDSLQVVYPMCVRLNAMFCAHVSIRVYRISYVREISCEITLAYRISLYRVVMKKD